MPDLSPQLQAFEELHTELKGTRVRYRPGFEGDDFWLRFILATTIQKLMPQEASDGDV